MIVAKGTVNLAALKPEMQEAEDVFSFLYEDILKSDCVVTSTNDAKHKPGSLHYKGLAFDCRTNGHSKVKVDLLVEKAKSLLEKKYDIIWDVPGHYNHIHVEYDPK